MEIGFIGLGRMGGNMVTRLVRGGHKILAYDPSPNAAKLAEANGATLTPSKASRSWRPRGRYGSWSRPASRPRRRSRP